MNLKSGLIATRTTGAIGWLIFDNPSKLNALSPGMSEDALTVIEARRDEQKLSIHRIRASGIRRSRSLRNNTPRSTPLYAPFTSKLTRLRTLPSRHASKIFSTSSSRRRRRR